MRVGLIKAGGSEGTFIIFLKVRRAEDRSELHEAHSDHLGDLFVKLQLMRRNEIGQIKMSSVLSSLS